MTTKEEIQELRDACKLLQRQIGALKLLYHDLDNKKMDKPKINIIKPDHLVKPN